ncbi:hypothetical protein ACIBG5_41415 [Kribbella sp. NPDC050241]|uniref:hypothetical protein n=1 Tax=Kribbella sp. NPDC050241 TaxID=3364115 RepID=UPI0037B21388
MTVHGHHAAPPAPPPIAAVAALLVAILSVVLIAFAWPAVRSQPRNVPIVVAGSPESTGLILNSLELDAPGAFEPKVVSDRQSAVAAIDNRDAYGAILTGPDGTEILTASAASPAIAQLLAQLGQRLGGRSAAPPRMTDVVPAPADDPRGNGLAAGAIPLLLGGIAGSTGLSRLVRSRSKRLAGGLAFSILGGLALTAIDQYWLGALTGTFWANAAVVALGIGSISITLLGLDWIGGFRPFALGAALMLLVGNPLSGLSSAPEMLPTGLGALGQFLPPGATGTAIRSVAFFDGAAAGRSLIVLGAWLVGGGALCALGALRQRLALKTLAARPPAVVPASA